MNLTSVVVLAQLFLLIFARVAALIFVAPLLSSPNIPVIAKAALALLVSMIVLPWMAEQGYEMPGTGLYFAALVIGEVLIGLILGFLLNVLYATFQLAGQFFAVQMGFSASQAYDPLSQVELPLVGQFLNLMAMFLFLIVGGFQQLFYVGIYRSFQVVTAYDFLQRRSHIFELVLRSIGGLFSQALVISLPILGTLFLVSVSIGLLAKAAPQMNLLMMSFPLNIFVGFVILFFTLPLIMESFGRIIDMGFVQLMQLLAEPGGGG